MGIVICMVKREYSNIHSAPTTSNHMVSVSNTATKRNNAVTTDAPTMPSGMVFASVMVQSVIAQSLGCGKTLFQAWKCRSHFTTKDVLKAANATVGMHHDASATAPGSVVGGQNFHFIDHDATILDITDLTLELIQQYVWMNNWENVLAFASVCKSRKDATDKYHLKIGVELMEGGDGRKLNMSEFSSYLDQEKFRLAKTMYVPCRKAMLFYCDLQPKCPRMRLLNYRQWLMMNGNSEFVVEGQSNHPCYCMYKHDHPYIDGVNAWIRWSWDRNYKLVIERQFVTDNTTRKQMRTKTTFYRC
jgi:hypothetical protein